MASNTSPADESVAVEANIKALESLLDEFFRDVSNERKAEIERMLTEFREQVTNWCKFKISKLGVRLGNLISPYLERPSKISINNTNYVYFRALVGVTVWCSLTEVAIPT